ncbi:MAG: hypothetical protein KF773_17935 [Deltaproteobacteria bacterium]|nr:hypothetical protein [Deltaproteobacteria bacterium]MCW5804846.1 hypothetical protein [Deltaproteobacteria bacterium]
MRTSLFAATLLLAVGSSVAHADDINVLGAYDVKYEEVSTNCGENKLTYRHGKLRIEQRGTNIVVSVENTPSMQGSPPRGGKVSAKSKSSETMLGGMKGVFSVAGRVTTEGQLRLVMIGEYSAGGKPLCSQSWNVSGPRAPAEAAPPKATPKK